MAELNTRGSLVTTRVMAGLVYPDWRWKVLIGAMSVHGTAGDFWAEK